MKNDYRLSLGNIWDTWGKSWSRKVLMFAFRRNTVKYVWYQDCSTYTPKLPIWKNCGLSLNATFLPPLFFLLLLASNHWKKLMDSNWKFSQKSTFNNTADLLIFLLHKLLLIASVIFLNFITPLLWIWLSSYCVLQVSLAKVVTKI